MTTTDARKGTATEPDPLPDPEVKPMLTVAEAAPYYRLGEVQMYRAVRNGDIPAIRIGRTWRIPTAEVRRAFGLSPRPEVS